MPSNGLPVITPAARPELKRQVARTDPVSKPAGNPLPTSGDIPAKRAAPPVAAPKEPPVPLKGDNSLQALISRLNKHLNDTGQPNQFRLDTASGSKQIQEINPATGDVVGEYSAVEFPALAQSLVFSGLIFDGHA